MRRWQLVFLAVVLAMTAALRLLMAAGGSSAFTEIAAPPAGAQWTRVGAVLEPTEDYEETSVQEPDVRYDAVNGWRMWVKVGWDTTALGYYTSADGLTWTPHASNPVLGAGNGGLVEELSQPMIYDTGSGLVCYFNQGGDHDPNTPRYATSADGITWTVGGSGSFITNPGSITQWGNRHVWKEGDSWFMLQEARQSAQWRIFYATSSDGLSWTLGNGSTAVITGAGGPTMYTTPGAGGPYTIWYHSSNDVESDIFRATSTNRINWTSNGPVLTHTGSGHEVDQVADPSVLVVDGTAYMFYAGVDNSGETGVILLATAPAS